MAKKRVAVATIHGIGQQKEGRRYSDRLRRQLVVGFGAERFGRTVAWEEIHYADILQARQDAYLTELESVLTPSLWTPGRRFVMNSLADASGYLAAAYREGAGHAPYRQTHGRIAQTLRRLDAETVDGAPLVIVAHSLGCQIVSDYFYDRSREAGPPVFEGGSTLAAMITMGCNIPIFVLALGPAEAAVRPQLPGRRWRDDRPWWFNYYDRSDVLGYPLAQLGGYRELRQDGGLTDEEVNAGSLFASWTPFSHNGYWSHRGIGAKLAEIVTHLDATLEERRAPEPAPEPDPAPAEGGEPVA